MAMDVVTLALAKKYTKDTTIGLGAIKGSPCTIQKSEDFEDDKGTGKNITYKWTGTDGTVQTQKIKVYDGKDGIGVDKIEIKEISDKKYFVMTLSDGTEKTIGEVPEGGSGDATLEENVKAMGVSVGAITDGTVIPKGTTFTQFVKMLTQKVIHPSYTKPSFSLSSTDAKVFEKGVAYTVNISPNFTKSDSGGLENIKWDDGTTSTTLSAKSYTLMNSMTIKCTANYKEGSTKKDNFGNDDATGKIVAGSINASIKFTAVDPFYHGVGAFSTTTSTKDVSEKGSKSYTYTLNDDVCHIAYPASYGNLKSIIDPSGFDNLATFTKTTETVNDVTYNVYTKTEPATLSGFVFKFNF